jgi:hypothetical protein
MRCRTVVSWHLRAICLHIRLHLYKLLSSACLCHMRFLLNKLSISVCTDSVTFTDSRNSIGSYSGRNGIRPNALAIISVGRYDVKCPDFVAHGRVRGPCGMRHMASTTKRGSPQSSRYKKQLCRCPAVDLIERRTMDCSASASFPESFSSGLAVIRRDLRTFGRRHVSVDFSNLIGPSEADLLRNEVGEIWNLDPFRES